MNLNKRKSAEELVYSHSSRGVAVRLGFLLIIKKMGHFWPFLLFIVYTLVSFQSEPELKLTLQEQLESMESKVDSVFVIDEPPGRFQYLIVKRNSINFKIEMCGSIHLQRDEIFNHHQFLLRILKDTVCSIQQLSE